jgi:hypothetical protein
MTDDTAQVPPGTVIVNIPTTISADAQRAAEICREIMIGYRAEAEKLPLDRIFSIQALSHAASGAETCARAIEIALTKSTLETA